MQIYTSSSENLSQILTELDSPTHLSPLQLKIPFSLSASVWRDNESDTPEPTKAQLISSASRWIKPKEMKLVWCRGCCGYSVLQER